MTLRSGNDNPECQARPMPPARDFTRRRVARSEVSANQVMMARRQSSTQVETLAARTLRDGVELCLLNLVGGWAAD